VLFFVSVGMLVDPRAIIETPALIGIILFVVIVVKPIVAIFAVRLLGKPFTMAIPIGAAFSQIGEFSFILGSVTRGLNLLDETGWNILVVVSIVSITLNPFIYKLAGNLSKKINRLALPDHASSEDFDPRHCIIVGYGPVGKIVHQLLAEQSLAITIIDLNLETVRKLRNHGYTAIYGDVQRQGTLEEAGIATAGTLILSADINDSSEIIMQAKKHNPQLRTIVRCNNLYDALKIKKAGASVVASGEAEVGVALAEAISGETDPDGIIDPEKRLSLRNKLYEINSENGSEAEKKKYEKAMIFSSGLSNGIIITDLSARTKEKALYELIEKSSKFPRIKNKEEFYKRVIEREQIANTYIDRGLAIPHAKTNAVSGIVISLAISRKGIDWEAPDDKPVHIIVLLGVQKSFTEKYLQLLSRIASVFNDPDIVAEVKRCASSNDLMSIIVEREKKIMSE
jgi:mannitol/fructose-specific phosphotransferase system IIA component (Ntr-type)/Trk K+ transport system NAD-binding subunit